MSNSHPVEPSPPDSKGTDRFVFLQSDNAPLTVVVEEKQRTDEAPHDGSSAYADGPAGMGSSSNQRSTMDAGSSSMAIEIDEKAELTAAAPKTPAMQTSSTPTATTKVDLYKAGAVDYNDDDDLTRQSLYLASDDLVVGLSLYHRSITRRVLWYLGCLLSAGILFIVAFWWPRIWLRWNCRPTSLESASLRKCKGQVWVAVKTRHEPLLLCLLETRKLADEVAVDYLFPSSMLVPAANALDQPRPVDRSSYEEKVVSEVRVLDYRSITFVLHPCGRFLTQADWKNPAWAQLAQVDSKDIKGLSTDKEHALLHHFFGPNVIDVRGNSIFSILINEVLHPFYIFQIASVVLWCNDDYIPYAIVILVVSFIGITSATIETKRSLNRLRKMSRFYCDTRVLRHGSWRIVPSTDLVPGDIVDVAASAETGGQLEVLPCDVILLESDAIASEAMLTGESVPVVKTAMPRSLFASSSSTGPNSRKAEKHTLFGGTKLIRARPASPTSPESKALVVRTGFHTAKGGLVRQMLFPKKFNFKFLRDAFMAIGCLFILAMMGVIASAVYFVHIGVDPEEIALRSLDVITIAVPPALPTAMSIAVTFALVRLKRKQIYCTSPQRINVAGMITACVFDKTGTLTEEGLAVLGVCASLENKVFGEPHRTHASLEQATKDGQAQLSDEEGQKNCSVDDALATTHDLNLLEGSLLGEPLEAAMFKWTEADLSEEPVPLYLPDGSRALTVDAKPAHVSVVSKGARKLAICKKFDFSSALRRMSVIVKGFDQPQGATVYVKGAPEAIVGLCAQNSFPDKYDEVLNHFTHNGFRVLAFAGKTLEGGSWDEVKGMSRANAESNLRFLGLLVFENKLKEGSAETVRLLKQGNIIAKMCTGDAPLTAIAVAREAGLVDANGPVYMARISGAPSSSEKEKMQDEEGEGDSDGDGEKNAAAASQVEWVDIADEGATLDAYSLQPRLRAAGERKLALADVGLAVSGETYAYMVDHAAKETMDRLLVKGTVFARFSPEQKQDLIERLQALDYAVAMVGDGANDMGALRSADVGLSLSEAEASVAAPFTTKDVRNVDCLLREGRNAITTSLALFDFMMIYSLCEYFSVLLLYGAPFFSTSFTNADYLYIDIFLVFPFAIGMSFSCPAAVLSAKRVKGRLMSRRNLISLLSQFVLLVLAQTTTYLLLHRQGFYKPPRFAPDDLDLQTMDNTILFKTSIFTYLFAATIWNWGPPHRRYLFQNYPLLLAIVVIASLNVYFVFATAGPFFDLFGFQDEIEAPRFLGIVFAVVVVQAILAFASEAYLVDIVSTWIRGPTRRVQRWYANSKGRAFSSDKAYRLVEASILVD